jgi:hypothetical protein
VFLFVGVTCLFLDIVNIDEKGCADGDPWWDFMSSDVKDLASVITQLS